jgi:hypothetical protein
MTSIIRSSAVVFAALWVGVLFCVGFVVAPYLFTLAARGSSVVPNTGTAAELIGPLLYGSDVLGMAVGAVLILALVFLRRRQEVPLGGQLYLSEIGLGVAIVCAAANYWLVLPAVKSVRGEIAERYGAFHLADRSDPLFERFGSLHQASTALFIATFTAALVCLVCLTQFRTREVDVLTDNKRQASPAPQPRV